MKKRLIISSVIISTLIGGNFTLAGFNYDICSDINLIDRECSRMSEEECREMLEKCGEHLDRIRARYERDLTITEAEKESLQYQIRTLENRIGNLEAEIERNRVIARNLGFQISDTQGDIEKTIRKIEESREYLSGMLRTINKENRKSTLEIILTEDDLSGFFNNITFIKRLSRESKDILDDVKALRASLESKKDRLTYEREEAERVARLTAMQVEESQAAKRTQEELYGMTEEEYQRQLAEKREVERTAEEIRQRIFELVGLPPDVDAPTFEEAYEIAKWVEATTGIRPAFLLSILQQESAIGRNVGQCYLSDTSSGRSTHIHNGQTFSNGMHPSRDIPPFLTITRELGRDPLRTPVSCPMNVGWGGAMGPAQFIPSTWQSVRPAVSNILGREPDPWSIRDSFLASGVLLTSSGAKSRTRDGEWRAAMIYFSGSTNNPAFYWYANQVIERADQFERDIDIMGR